MNTGLTLKSLLAQYLELRDNDKHRSATVMHTFKVYHSKNHSFQVVDVVEFNDDNYALVAEVDAEDVDAAYKLTNNIGMPWTMNKGVRLSVPGRFRSTSVGDVIVTDDGTRLLCQVIGWKEI